jgi:hypothetical protein
MKKKKRKKRLTGYRTVVAAALLALLTYLQSDTVTQLIAAQPAIMSGCLFIFIAALRALTTTPMFERK